MKTPPRRSPKLNAALAACIKQLAKNGDLLQHEIAARLNINQGRVSEVLTGKRYRDVQPE